MAKSLVSCFFRLTACSATSALGVLNDYALYKSTHSLTQSLAPRPLSGLAYGRSRRWKRAIYCRKTDAYKSARRMPPVARAAGHLNQVTF